MSRNDILNRLRRHGGSVMPLPRQPAVNRQDIETGNTEGFARQATANNIGVIRANSLDHASALIEEYLVKSGLNGSVVVAGCLQVFFGHSTRFETGTSNGQDQVCISMAYAGIEDTGTFITLSDSSNPTLLNFLAEVHFLVLPTQRIYHSKMDIWKLLALENRELPRALNFISGPSRTADIEQTLQLGAHGPKQLIGVLVSGT